VRKTLGLESGPPGKKVEKKDKVEEKRDFSLKEGESIVVNIGGRGKGRRSEAKSEQFGGGELGGFSLPPPPGAGGGGFLPPPPSAQEVKAQKRRSQNLGSPEPGSIEDLGFDDGEFGEFQ